ncbi:hypothetical protein ACHAXN_003862 [Cyclotella atomus]
MAAASSPMKHSTGSPCKRSLRGIKNPSDTACHTSSSLQLLYHCFPSLRCALLDLSSISSRENRDIAKKDQTAVDFNNELVYHLSHFYHLLTYGQHAAKPLSPKRQVRKRMKQSLSPTQQMAVQDFMTRSEYGVSSGEDWKRLVAAMRESNRECYDDVLGRVLSASGSFENDAQDEIGESIDPTKFYEQLANYTTSNESSNITPIQPSQLGDSATIFRSLLHALEFSTRREVERTKSQCEMLEVERWNDEDRRGDGSFESLSRLKDALERVRDAMKEEWSGLLTGRIVGTCETTKTEDLQNSKSESAKITSTTTIRRTKKNGSIERAIPVPFPLPVVQQVILVQPDSSTEDSAQPKQDGKQYYQSLTSSLYSMTIEPNPIRGYDWHGLMKRGEVVEETFVRKIDANGNEIVEQQSDANKVPDSNTKSLMHLDGLSVVRAHEKQKKKDDTSVASRSIGVQTDSREMEGDKILIPQGFIQDTNKVDKAVEMEPNSDLHPHDDKEKDLQTSLLEEDTTKDGKAGEQSPPEEPTDLQKQISNNTIVGTPSVYALAVAAIAANKPMRRDRKVFLQKTKSFKVNKDELSPGVGTLSGMEVGAQSNSIQPSPIELESSPILGADSHSVEESTVDSKVSSVDGDQSSMTHSSAIETPSDIDEISLGSFTESEDEASKKSEPPRIPMLDVTVDEIKDVGPDNIAGEDTAAPQAARQSSAPPLDAIQSARSTPTNILETKDSHASSSNSTSDDSSSSSSYTSSSSDSSASSDSSSSEENISSNLPESALAEKDKASTNESKHEWVTRKETRFRHPLPKNLIFQLKRFEYSTVLGRVESIPVTLDIPPFLELQPCCLDRACKSSDDELNACCYKYLLSGAIVHVAPMENNEALYGESTVGHYVTFVNTAASKLQSPTMAKQQHWFEMDDDKVNQVDQDTCSIADASNAELSPSQLALKVLSGCNVMGKEPERRYATMVVYSRACDCARETRKV